MTDIIQLDKGQSKEFQMTLPLKLDEKMVKAADKFFKQVGKKEPEKNIGSQFYQLISRGLQPSITAQRITCEYVIEVHARPEGFNATSSLKPCILPVFIYRDSGRIPIIPPTF